MHYRRPTQDNIAIKIHDSYAGMNKNKLPYMKQQMQNRVKQIETSHRANEKRNLDSIMLMHDKNIKKGLKTVDKNRYKQ